MPSSKPIFSCRLPEELRSKAEARAELLGVSLNALVAVALAAYLAVEPGGVGLGRRLGSPVGALLSRNSLCGCGSGKKRKRCCFRQDPSEVI